MKHHSQRSHFQTKPRTNLKSTWGNLSPSSEIPDRVDWIQCGLNFTRENSPNNNKCDRTFRVFMSTIFKLVVP